MFADAQAAGYQQNKLQCTAEDIDIAEVIVNEFRVFFPGDDPPFQPLPDGDRIECLPGQTIEVNVDAVLENNAQERYDIGLWINPDPTEADPLDPGAGANTGSECLHFNLVNGEPGVSILDNTPDDCGDMSAGVQATVNLEVLSFACEDPDGNGEVDLDACTAWENNTTGANEVVCPLDPPGGANGFRQGTTPGTGSKCKCEQLGLPIDIKGVLRVAKVTVPDPDPTEPDQEFTFNSDAITSPFQLSNGETEVSDPLSAGTYNVTETVPAGWSLTDVSCVETVGGAPANSTPNGNGVDVTLGQADDVTCTFTNTKDALIIVDKVTDPTGSPQSFSFSGTACGAFSLTDAAAPEECPVAPDQTYSVSETVPSGWALTSATCDNGDDPAAITPGPGETVTCTFTNTQDGLIIVDKVTDPSGSPQSFDFTGTACGPFSLTDAAAPNECPQPPGTYSVSETVPSGWVLTSATCSDGSDPASIDLDAGETVTCTFTNTQNGLIIVDKVTDPPGDPQSFDFDGTACGPFSLTDAATPEECIQPPGTYSVSETVPMGWGLISATCDDGSDPSAIDLDAGETVTCTFTNEKAAFITVEKVCVTADPSPTQDFSFTSDFAGGPGDIACGGSDTSDPLDPGTYSVSETVPPGWSLASATCDDGSDPSSIGLSAGETVTCTFTNEQDGLIIVDKVTDPPGSPQSFDFDGTACGPFSLTDAATPEECPQPAGTYSVSETVPAGWELKSATCDDGSNPASINLGAGETVTCTFTNEEDAFIIVEKVCETTDPAPTQTFGFNSDFGVTGPLSCGGNESSAALDPGTYSVSESVPAGWDLISATCDDGSDPGSIGLDAGETVTCTFTNRERAMVKLTKLVNGVPNAGTEWTFSLNGPEVSEEVTFTGSMIDFNGAKLIIGETYTICEEGLPAGWSANWTQDGGAVVPTPDPVDNSILCFDFTPMSPGDNGRTIEFVVDNIPPPEGDPRTIGYWKNWSTCSNGRQAETAARNGGAAEGFFLIDDVLPLMLGGFVVATCEDAVNILDKSSIDGRKRANDAAYALASQLLAALANTSPVVNAGCTPGNFAQQVMDAQQLLTDIGFDGTGSYLRPRDGGPRGDALDFAEFFDEYNNGGFCF